MNNFNIPEDKLSSLLQMAGKKLGRDPQQLRADLESGKLDNVMKGMDAGAAGKLNNLLQNPKAMETLLQNDKIRGMLGGLMGGKK